MYINKEIHLTVLVYGDLYLSSKKSYISFCLMSKERERGSLFHLVIQNLQVQILCASSIPVANLSLNFSLPYTFSKVWMKSVFPFMERSDLNSKFMPSLHASCNWYPLYNLPTVTERTKQNGSWLKNGFFTWTMSFFWIFVERKSPVTSVSWVR